MATLSIGMAHLTIGAHKNSDPGAGMREGAGILSRFYRFASAAQESADRYPNHKYNDTDWWMFRL